MASKKRSSKRSYNHRKKASREDVLRSYMKTAGIVVAVVAVIAVIWLIVKPFRQRAQRARLEASSSESEALEITVEPERDDGSGQAGRATIPDGMSVQFDTPGWQHDDRGWWYASDERTFYVNGWLTLDQKEYHFSSNGYMDTGWTPIGGKGCYFDEHGVYDATADSSHMIALTFDDGPYEYTTDLLNALEANGARATFFMLGEMVEQYGADTIPQMVRLGCQLGNHSYDHSDMTTLSTSEALKQFQETDEQIAKYSGGSAASVIRFPYGSYNDTLKSKIDKPSIYWDYDTVDWQGTAASVMAEKIVSEAEGGNIILMHDIHENSVDAVKLMLPRLKEAGFELVTVSELAAARGYTLETGVTYFGFTDTEISHGTASDKETVMGPEEEDENNDAAAPAEDVNTGNDENSDGSTESEASEETQEQDETQEQEESYEEESYEGDSEESSEEYYDEDAGEEDSSYDGSEDYEDESQE